MKKLLTGLVVAASLIVGCAFPPKDIEGVLKEYRKIKYVPEPRFHDYWQNPEETDRLKTADCEDLASWLDKEFKKRSLDKKYNSRIAIGKAPLNLNPLTWHAWFEIEKDGKVYVIDEDNRFMPKPYELTFYKKMGVLTDALLGEKWRMQGNLPNYLMKEEDYKREVDAFVRFLMRK